jgi:hypothetical protein
MPSTTLSHEAMVRSQRFGQEDEPYGVEIYNPDVQRRAEYEVVLREGERLYGLRTNTLKAGERVVEEMAIDGGEITVVGRVDIVLTWPVPLPDRV